MIYFVDEDLIQLEAFKVELKILGYKVDSLSDADQAYHVLSKCSSNELDIAIIDVMLAADIDATKSKYNRSRTDDYLQTGLRLLDDLCKINPNVFPKKAMLFSMASDTALLSDITATSEKYNVPFLDKNKYSDALEFGEIINDHIQHISKGDL